MEDIRRAKNNLLQLLNGIILEVADHAEAVAERRGQHARPRRRADERKMGQIEADGPGRRALPDHDIDRKIFHRGIEDLLDLPVQPVDLIDK